MKPYKVTRINKDIGAAVKVYEVLTSITKKNGWQRKKKMTDTIVGMNTKNLLRFYKAERKRFYNGEPTENFSMDDWANFLNLIKDELDLREHIN